MLNRKGKALVTGRRKASQLPVIDDQLRAVSVQLGQSELSGNWGAASRCITGLKIGTCRLGPLFRIT